MSNHNQQQGSALKQVYILAWVVVFVNVKQLKVRLLFNDA